MSHVCVGQPPSAVSRKKRGITPAKVFGTTVKARDGWGPEQLVHLHRHITPQTIDIAGGRDAIHCRIHTHAAPGRK